MNNHSIETLFMAGIKSWVVDVLADSLNMSKKNVRDLLGILKQLYTFASGKKTIEEEARANHELVADRYAVNLTGNSGAAVNTFLKLSGGNVQHPTHVSIDGNFEIPAITFDERIRAIRGF